MPHFRHQRRLPYPRESLFDLVADVESYPEFLPGWRHARILARDRDTLHVEQTLGAMGLTFRFRTRATLDRPESIRIETREHPFRHLEQYWRFRPLDTDSTLTILEADYTVGDMPLRFMLTGFFDLGFKQTLQAFEDRARQRLSRG